MFPVTSIAESLHDAWLVLVVPAAFLFYGYKKRNERLALILKEKSHLLSRFYGLSYLASYLAVVLLPKSLMWFGLTPLALALLIVLFVNVISGVIFANRSVSLDLRGLAESSNGLAESALSAQVMSWWSQAGVALTQAANHPDLSLDLSFLSKQTRMPKTFDYYAGILRMIDARLSADANAVIDIYKSMLIDGSWRRDFHLTVVVVSAYFELNQFEAGLDVLGTTRIIKANFKFVDSALGRLYALLGMMDNLEKSHLLCGEHLLEYTRRFHLGLCQVALVNENEARQQLTLCLDDCAIVLAPVDSAARNASGGNLEHALEAPTAHAKGMTVVQVQAAITRKKALQYLDNLDQRIVAAQEVDYELYRQKLLQIRDKLS